MLNLDCLFTYVCRHFLPFDKRAAFIEIVKQEKKRILFERHFYYFNMTVFGETIDLINMVRDPVERIISNFHFVRNPSRWIGREVSPKKSWIAKKSANQPIQIWEHPRKPHSYKFANKQETAMFAVCQYWLFPPVPAILHKNMSLHWFKALPSTSVKIKIFTSKF